MSKILVYILLYFTFSCLLIAGNNSKIYLGARLGGNLGQGSGKGYWDWTGPDQDGSLYPLPGYGGGITLNWERGSGLVMEGALLYNRCSAGQKIDSIQYSYYQDMIEVPLMLKAAPLFSEKVCLGVGPSLIYLPVKGARDDSEREKRKESMSRLRFLGGIQAGMDILLYRKAQSSLFCNLRFSHPFVAPEYDWEEKGSGRYRINHFDLSLEFRRRVDK